MERFQKIRNNRRKFDISSICRFCGLENEERYNILQLNEDGVEFATKVSSMIGIKVHGTDKMPQNVCFICMDKINDFYEFRLMALNTEKQTRDALGLPLEEEPPKPQVKPQIITKPAIVRLIDLKHSTKDSYLIQRALERLNQKQAEQNIPSTSGFKRETTPAATITQPPVKKTRKDISCPICVDTYFSYINDLQDHQMKEHLPLISKYACGSCRETFDQLSDFKAHENMHTQRKLPYICYFCKSKYSKLRDFQRHMLNFNCPMKKKLPLLVEDIKCFQCKKKFLTQNLFEWHGCFLKTRGTCIKCGLYVQKKKTLLKHYVLCKEKFVTPLAARDPNEDKIKSEQISPTRGSVINISTVSSVKSKGVRKKTVPQRRTTVFKAEKEVNLSTATVVQQDEEDDEYANYEEDITYDNFGSDEEDEDQTITNLEPVVQLQEQPVPRIIDIKAEKSNDFEAIKQLTIPANNPSIDTPIIRNIKREQASKQAIVSTNKQKSVPGLNIKAEKAANEQSVVQVLNPLAVSKVKPSQMTARKKVFKLPQELAMKIKKERLNPAYDDNMHEMRDEAEPDPEEEAQMEQSQQSPNLIKQEKLESESNAIKVISNPSRPPKQFINPIALAMMREKNAQKALEASKNGSGSLIISAVTSMSDTPLNGESKEDTNEISSESVETPIKSHVNAVDENAQNDKLNEINSSNEKSTPESNPVMIEIPAEFSKPTEEHHYSPGVETTQPDNKELSPIVEPEMEKTNEVETSISDSTVKETQAINNNDDDELDQLLQKYGDIDDTNDLHDSDLQDLLKFD
ncbi:microtubule-associated protein futsch [Chironomus tepperi]|uniref:microtubule-associated protein futsch n=1 Tax=Chironomus tepperi TaxID=113505 RepID=UPI00391EED78